MFAFTLPHWKSAIRIGLLLVVFLVLSACAGTQEATVGGNVEFDGQLMKSGTVTFIDKDGKSHSAAISEKGTYRIQKLPPGTVKIQIAVHARSPFAKFEGANPKNDLKNPEPVLEIPEKYKDAQKSGLIYDVKPASEPQTHDIRLQKS
jgi:hypothetical protein